MVGWCFFFHNDWPQLRRSGSTFQSCISALPLWGDWLIDSRHSCAELSPSEPRRNFWSNSFWALCQINLRTKTMKNLWLPSGCWLPVRRALKSVTVFHWKRRLEFVMLANANKRVLTPDLFGAIYSVCFKCYLYVFVIICLIKRLYFRISIGCLLNCVCGKCVLVWLELVSYVAIQPDWETVILKKKWLCFSVSALLKLCQWALKLDEWWVGTVCRRKHWLRIASRDHLRPHYCCR